MKQSPLHLINCKLYCLAFNNTKKSIARKALKIHVKCPWIISGCRNQIGPWNLLTQDPCDVLWELLGQCCCPTSCSAGFIWVSCQSAYTISFLSLHASPLSPPLCSPRFTAGSVSTQDSSVRRRELSAQSWVWRDWTYVAYYGSSLIWTVGPILLPLSEW